MSTKTKTLLIILGTLVIGVAIGALGSGVMRHNRLEKFERMDHSRRFLHAMENIIQPDTEQKAEIESVMEKYSNQMVDIRERHQGEITTILDSMRNALDGLLTDEQKNRLQTHFEKSANRMMERRLSRLSDMLDLSNDQFEKIEQIFQKRSELFTRGRHKMFKGKFENKLQNIREEMEKMNAEIEAVLTPEQAEKFQEFREDRFMPFERGFPGEHRRKKWDRK